MHEIPTLHADSRITFIFTPDHGFWATGAQEFESIISGSFSPSSVNLEPSRNGDGVKSIDFESASEAWRSKDSRCSVPSAVRLGDCLAWHSVTQASTRLPGARPGSRRSSCRRMVYSRSTRTLPCSGNSKTRSSKRAFLSIFSPRSSDTSNASMPKINFTAETWTALLLGLYDPHPRESFSRISVGCLTHPLVRPTSGTAVPPRWRTILG